MRFDLKFENRVLKGLWRILYIKLCMLRTAIEINVQQDFNQVKILCIFGSVAGDVATEFKWF